MNVKQLKQALAKFDDDLEIMIHNGEKDCEEEYIRLFKAQEMRLSSDSDGDTYEAFPDDVFAEHTERVLMLISD